MRVVLVIAACVLSMYSFGQGNKKSIVLFEKKKMDCENKNDNTHAYFKLVLGKDENRFLQCQYMFDFTGYNAAGKIKLIEALLSFEGDTSLCAAQPKCYNARRSQLVPGQIRAYSIQVEALFLVNHIIYENPYNFSSFPILKSRNGTSLEAIGGPLVRQAYVAYKAWLQQAKKVGFNELRSKGIIPFSDDSTVVWL